MEVKFDDILSIYEKEIRVTSKNKRKVFLFEKNKIQNISRIVKELREGTYTPSKYNVFIVFEPKCRIVMSLNIRDKIVNHYMARYVLLPKLSKYLDIRNVATRKNMGVGYANRLIKYYLNDMKKSNNIFYILKLDIKKYFYNIDHNILLGKLKDRLSSEEYNIINRIISSTNSSYINMEIDNIKASYKGSKDLSNIPYYLNDKGLSLGAMVSQFLSIYYLNEMDHFIVHNLHIKRYIRYMDDLVLFHHDKEVLKKIKDILIEKFKNEYKLEVNNKTKIYRSDEYFIFLGKRYRVVNNKTIKKCRSNTYYIANKRIKRVNKLYKSGVISFAGIYSAYANYKGMNNYKIVQAIDKNIGSS